jgi:hypothetical protein
MSFSIGHSHYFVNLMWCPQIHRLPSLPEMQAVGMATYFGTSNAHQQSSSGEIGSPEGPGSFQGVSRNNEEKNGSAYAQVK